MDSNFTFQGANNAGMYEASRGYQLTGQVYGESAAHFQARQNAYNFFNHGG